MPSPRQLISFDWALKKLLRSKANFKVLEGFLSELLHDDIRILEVLESEGNKESQDDKHNRVDLLVKDRLQRRIIIEVQFSREDDYFQRILYGAAKILTESMAVGKAYKDITRVVSVSIVYFDLGQGEDYIYEGTTEFRGLHRHDRLGLTDYQKSLFAVSGVEEIFPEYYILKVNKFDDIARDGLDQWVYFLKNGKIKPTFHAQGLREAQEALNVLKLTDSERLAYETYLHEQRIEMGVAQSTVLRAEAAEKALESERRLKEEAKAREEEAKAREEEAKAQAGKALAAKDAAIQAALSALIAAGMTEHQARAALGLPA